MGIGEKLDNLLQERKISPAELARRINVPATTIYSIIQRNNKKVDINVLLDIAGELGVSAEYFRDGEKPESLAAHFSADEYTPEELEEINQFAHFVKDRRKK